MNASRSAPQDDLTASVERVLLQHARRNELIIAYVRAVALANAACLDYLFHLYPQVTIGQNQFPIENAQIAGIWTLFAFAALWVLRGGWYHASLRWIMPLLDGIVIVSIFAIIFHEVRLGPNGLGLHPVVVVAAVCTFFATTGALRLSWLSAALTTGLAVAIFAWVSFLISYTLAQSLFVCGMIVSAGLLGMHMANIARQAVDGETRRVILQRFLPASLMNADPSAALAMIGEPRQVNATILISDMRGFTAYAEHVSPEQVLSFLNQLQGRFATAVREHGGVVDKFMGDGMLAVFGAAEPLPDHAGCALAAARDMLAATAEVNALRAQRGEPSIGVGIGIHSGEAVVGCLGSGLRLEFTVIGDVVNIASRLESGTKELGVELLLSQNSRELIAAGASAAQVSKLKPAGEVSLRGRQQLLRVYTLA